MRDGTRLRRPVEQERQRIRRRRTGAHALAHDAWSGTEIEPVAREVIKERGANPVFGRIPRERALGGEKIVERGVWRAQARGAGGHQNRRQSRQR